ncbi:MAG TPA: hypothetical protein VH144_01740 [Candidatus Saccharimonadales bacterium]|nr:hypothetical protein [Candidatus Saccharimonadales bacterium]
MHRHRRSESSAELEARKLQVAFYALSHHPEVKRTRSQPIRRYYNLRGIVIGIIDLALVEAFEPDQLKTGEAQRLFWSFISVGLVQIEKRRSIGLQSGLRYWIEDPPANLYRFVIDREKLLRGHIWTALLEVSVDRSDERESPVQLRISELIRSQACQLVIVRYEKQLLIEQVERLRR